jgi:hypothetical protein
MTGVAGEIGSGPAIRRTGQRRAAGIYGAIITAAVLAAGGDELHTAGLIVAVLLTLVVYWLAEEYAELLGEQVRGGMVPTWDYIREELATTWPMVTASFAPLLALVLARLAGASIPAADNVGLVIAVMLLVLHGWSAGRAAQLRGWQLAFTTSVAVGLGLLMVALKELVLLYLH